MIWFDQDLMKKLSKKNKQRLKQVERQGFKNKILEQFQKKEKNTFISLNNFIDLKFRKQLFTFLLTIAIQLIIFYKNYFAFLLYRFLRIMTLGLISSFIHLNNIVIDNQQDLDTIHSNSEFLFATLKSVLIQIDPKYFQQFVQTQLTLEDIQQLTCQYYQKALSESKLPKLRNNKIQQLQYIFKLVFGLAIKLDDQKYVSNIMKLKETDQQILLPFIKCLLFQRQEQNEQKDKKEYDERIDSLKHIQQIQQKQNLIEHYKERYEQILKQHNQFKEQYEILQQQNKNLKQEIEMLKFEKGEMLFEMGVTTTQDFLILLKKMHENQHEVFEQIQNYKQQINHLNLEIGNLKKMLIEKNQQKKAKQSILEQSLDMKPNLSNLTETSQYSKKQIQQLKQQNLKLSKSTKKLQKYVKQLKQENNIIKVKEVTKTNQIKKLSTIANNFQVIKNLNNTLRNSISSILFK